jgi:zinc transport system permease protein
MRTITIIHMGRGVIVSEIMLYPLLISIPLSVLIGPVGSILVWRKSSFLGDVVSHMGILAFAVSQIMQWPILVVSTGVSIVVAVVLEWAPSIIPRDAWLSGVSSLGIAIGLMVLSQGASPHGFEHVFWGDVLTLNEQDLTMVMIAAGFLGMHLIVFWKSLMLVIFHEHLASLDGVPVRFVKLVTNVIAGIVIALSLKVMGVLLTGALFVLPSIGLRFMNLTPERHMLGAILGVLFSFIVGIYISIHMDMIVAPWVIFTLISLNIAIFFIKKGIDIWREK